MRVLYIGRKLGGGDYIAAHFDTKNTVFSILPPSQRSPKLSRLYSVGKPERDVVKTFIEGEKSSKSITKNGHHFTLVRQGNDACGIISTEALTQQQIDTITPIILTPIILDKDKVSVLEKIIADPEKYLDTDTNSDSPSL